MNLLNNRNKDLWLHIAFWCVYFSFHIYQVSVFQKRVEVFDWNKGALLLATQFFTTILIAYLNYFIFLPRFLKNKKFWRFLLEFGLVFAVLVVIRVHLQRYIVDGYTFTERRFYSSTFSVQIVAGTLFVTIFIGLLRFVGDWFRFEATKKEVENEKLTSELNFLRAQINPHFLFNTLNNLYYLAYTKSDSTTEVIAKLSLVMRYMIYEANQARVLLAKEIEYMENYISLERIRLTNQIPIRFDVTGSRDNALIAPLILITFLENAFKHGVTNIDANAWVNIRLAVQADHLVYEVENSKIATAAEGNGKSGIGLANVRRRLELLYPGQYELLVNEDEKRYYIKLKLPVH